MKHLPLAIGSALCLTFFAAVGCRPKPKSDIVGEPSPDQPPSSPIIASPTQQPSSSPLPSQPLEVKAEKAPSLDLPKLANRVQPAVILVTVFDSSGKLLRTETGFFISDDGRFVTTARAIETSAWLRLSRAFPSPHDTAGGWRESSGRIDRSSGYRTTAANEPDRPARSQQPNQTSPENQAPPHSL